MQIDIGRVNEQGVLTDENDAIAICGFVRHKGLFDEAFPRVAKEKGYKTFEQGQMGLFTCLMLWCAF